MTCQIQETFLTSVKVTIASKEKHMWSFSENWLMEQTSYISLEDD